LGGGMAVTAHATPITSRRSTRLNPVPPHKPFAAFIDLLHFASHFTAGARHFHIPSSCSSRKWRKAAADEDAEPVGHHTIVLLARREFGRRKMSAEAKPASRPWRGRGDVARALAGRRRSRRHWRRGILGSFWLGRGRGWHRTRRLWDHAESEASSAVLPSHRAHHTPAAQARQAVVGVPLTSTSAQ
jgi:hypothetical protein